MSKPVEPLTDESIFPFGQYKRAGVAMKDVPIKDLRWMWKNLKLGDTDLLLLELRHGTWAQKAVAQQRLLVGDWIRDNLIK